MYYNGPVKKLAWLVNAVRNPVEMVLFVYSFGLLLFALFLISPFYVANAGSSIWQIVPERAAEMVVGLLFFLVSLPGTIAPFQKKTKRVATTKKAALCMFSAFLFLAILRILIYGWLPATWLPLLMISLTSGGLRLYLEVRRV